MGSFSFASVILSYFLVGGGTFLTGLIAMRLGIQNEYLGYGIMAVGGGVGGFIAARASHGSTIIEPAIGAAIMLASIVGLGLAVGGEATRNLILLPSNMKGIALTGAASAGGGIVGAFISEKMLGESSQSSIPWLLYTAVAGFGAGVMGTIFGGVIGHGDSNGTIVGLVAVGCVLVGMASGASARVRPLLASLLGGAIGAGAFFYLAVVVLVAVLGKLKPETGSEIPSDVYAGLAVMAGGAGIVTMIGTLIGWYTVGNKAKR